MRGARANAAAEHERRLVARAHLDVHAADLVGHDEQFGVGDERLRAEDALRLGAPDLRAAVAPLEQQEALNDLGAGRAMQRARDRRELGVALEVRDRRRIRVHHDVRDGLAGAGHGWAARGRTRGLLRAE